MTATEQAERWLDHYFNLKVGDEVIYTEITSQDIGITGWYDCVVDSIDDNTLYLSTEDEYTYMDDMIYSPLHIDGHEKRHELNILKFSCWEGSASALNPTIYVRHLKNCLQPVDYHRLVRSTFQFARKKLIFQEKHCRYKRCQDHRIGHLINFIHSVDM